MSQTDYLRPWLALLAWGIPGSVLILSHFVQNVDSVISELNSGLDLRASQAQLELSISKEFTFFSPRCVSPQKHLLGMQLNRLTLSH